MDTGPLRGRTVVVTGAARGIDAALAHELARRGARVALLGHERAGLEATAAALPGPSLVREVDVTDLDALRAAAREVRERLAPPSAVVANAGIAAGGPFLASDPEGWRRVLDVNVVGSAHTARAFLPDLLATSGYFLQIASLAAVGGAPLLSAYSVSKAGVEAFAHTLRAETAHRGVAVGIAYLNWVDTAMLGGVEEHGVLRGLRASMPPPARGSTGAGTVAARLARAVERRRTAVYVPGWLRLVQPVRAALPPVVLRVARRRLPRIEAATPFRDTGPLGAGGRADRPGADRPGAGPGV
ncbi:short-chain dehydrogenase [Streptomyces longispororuber]|uniref:Short-chain dehydrogenase n=1 Tax=Streptomyces longispororuber TaxID=68230 RepID=A0A918ZI99_9ACTN|nr:SDR family oxidoreductase [Streptomyces longispororuber]GHE53032.1 short-chain dehydrogenase [Streptomyces longispororuber]